jgi:hypothetical protein
MKCVLCDKRKAKRPCPAKGALICAQCCGEKRVLQMDCPETCTYLRAGRERESEDYRRHLQRMDPADQEKSRRILQEYQDVIAHLEYALARQRLLVRDLTDRDVVEAAGVLLATYRTEDKGILYENTSDNLRIESLRRELRETVESHRNPEGEREKGIVDSQNVRLPLHAAMDCLEYIRSLAGVYLKDRRSDSGYVDSLARMIPKGEKQHSIILP